MILFSAPVLGLNRWVIVKADKLNNLGLVAQMGRALYFPTRKPGKDSNPCVLQGHDQLISSDEIATKTSTLAFTSKFPIDHGTLSEFEEVRAAAAVRASGEADPNHSDYEGMVYPGALIRVR